MNQDGNLFTNIDDEYTSYIIGLLITDGNIYKNTISFENKNYELMLLVKNYLNTTNKIILKTKIINNKECYWYRLGYDNKFYVKRLQTYGISANKSFTINLNIAINNHMFRGIFDGDGSVNTLVKDCNRVRVAITTGSLHFAEQINHYLCSKHIVNNIYKRLNVFDVVIQRKHDIEKIYYLLYNTHNYKSIAKYNKFNQILTCRKQR